MTSQATLKSYSTVTDVVALMEHTVGIVTSGSEPLPVKWTFNCQKLSIKLPQRCLRRVQRDSRPDHLSTNHQRQSRGKLFCTELLSWLWDFESFNSQMADSVYGVVCRPMSGSSGGNRITGHRCPTLFWFFWQFECTEVLWPDPEAAVHPPRSPYTAAGKSTASFSLCSSWRLKTRTCPPGLLLLFSNLPQQLHGCGTTFHQAQSSTRSARGGFCVRSGSHTSAN